MKRKIENQKVKIAAAKAALESMSAPERAKAEVKIGTMEKQLSAMETAMSEIEAEKAKKKEERLQEKADVSEANRESIVSDFGDWAENLDFDGDGRIKPTLWNVETIIANHPKWGANIRRNRLTSMIELGRDQMTDAVENEVYIDLYNMTGIDNKRWVQDSIVYTAGKNSYHPVLEAVEDLEWNPETDRDVLQDFFIKTIGAEDNALNREMSFRWLCAMYRRVAHPGCYFDAYLIVSDPVQGTGKSTIFERLTGGLGIKRGDGTGMVLTAVNCKPDTGDKDKMMIANSSVIVQFDESDEMKYTKLEKFKSFITVRQIKMRLPYGKYTEDFNIHCVYSVTTNDEKFLTDTDAKFERRAWVMKCNGTPDRSSEEWANLVPDALIKQIWAEAKYWDGHQDECYERYGYAIKGGDIHRLTKESKAALTEVQMTAKTMEDDAETINAIQEIFTSKYTKKVFDTPQAFISDRTAWTSNGERTSTIDIVPVKWVVSAVNRLVHGSKNRSMNYVSSMMGSPSVRELIGDWSKELKRYNGVQVTCFVRKGSEDDDTQKQKTALKTVVKQVEKKRKPKPGEFGSDGLFDDFEVDF